jgi:hypothetical protein
MKYLRSVSQGFFPGKPRGLSQKAGKPIRRIASLEIFAFLAIRFRVGWTELWCHEVFHEHQIATDLILVIKDNKTPI